MNNSTRLIAVLAGTILAAASPTTAQTTRGFLAVNGGMLSGSEGLRQAQDFEHALFGPEMGRRETVYPDGGGTTFDVAGGVKVWRQLAVGGGVSRFSRQDDLRVTAQLPHPFYFDRAREIMRTEPNIAREETAVHLQAMWVAPVGASVEIALFGGASFFTVTQEVATGINFTQTYPYDSATFVSVERNAPSESAIGFNAGADVGVYFTRMVGVGGTIRYTQATVELGGTEFAAGGLLASGGLRLRF